MSKVLRLRTANSAVADEDPFIADLQGMVWNSQGVHGTWQQLADKSGLCYGTVRNFAIGETVRPQARTVQRLLMALDCRLAVVPASAPTVPGEIDLTQYRETKRVA